MSDEEKNKIETIQAFVEKNAEEGLRVFVAGGARSGNDEIYVEEAYELGRQIIKMDLRLDFGLSNSGIMGAVAQGVIDGWNKKAEKDSKSPIQGITTTDYFKLYPQDDNLLNQIGEVVQLKHWKNVSKNCLMPISWCLLPAEWGLQMSLHTIVWQCKMDFWI